MGKQPILLGDIARDRLTGFQGVVIARTQWLSNCDRLTLQPKVEGGEGKFVEALTFDETTLEFVEHTEFTKASDEPVAHGGPRPEPVRTGVR
jgi:hypothetical protein